MDKKEKNSDVVIAILAKQLNKDLKEVTPEKRIKEDLKADSLDIVDVILTIEKKFNVTVPDSAAETIKTVDDLIAFVDKF